MWAGFWCGFWGCFIRVLIVGCNFGWVGLGFGVFRVWVLVSVGGFGLDLVFELGFGEFVLGLGFGLFDWVYNVVWRLVGLGLFGIWFFGC